MHNLQDSTQTAKQVLPPVAYTTPLSGLHLQGDTLAEHLQNRSDGPQLLVFVRHFGCIFCREMVADLRKATRKNPQYPAVTLFYQGTIEEGRRFFRNLWPGVPAVADKPKYFYNAFGLNRGGTREMFGPKVWACGVRAAAKGYFIGKPVGDPWVMPGLFLVQGREIRWQYDFAHAGDHPNFSRLPQQLGLAQP